MYVYLSRMYLYLRRLANELEVKMEMESKEKPQDVRFSLLNACKLFSSTMKNALLLSTINKHS